ncbi:hypothetical protein AVEN_152580-1 [Araneus ventricosus]|uniref:Uncharacterized protein n=1 Tax=Araneus ventricosus TaxID=182803 RepID=A0A4Y2FVJ0_ARAVE|nr:hypothetical protein AVEN_152580-1 [Araneus ventricosus]
MDPRTEEWIRPISQTKSDRSVTEEDQLLGCRANVPKPHIQGQQLLLITQVKVTEYSEYRRHDPYCHFRQPICRVSAVTATKTN